MLANEYTLLAAVQLLLVFFAFAYTRNSSHLANPQSLLMWCDEQAPCLFLVPSRLNMNRIGDFRCGRKRNGHIRLEEMLDCRKQWLCFIVVICASNKLATVCHTSGRELIVSLRAVAWLWHDDVRRTHIVHCHVVYAEMDILSRFCIRLRLNTSRGRVCVVYAYAERWWRCGLRKISTKTRTSHTARNSHGECLSSTMNIAHTHASTVRDPKKLSTHTHTHQYNEAKIGNIFQLAETYLIDRLYPNRWPQQQHFILCNRYYWIPCTP